MAKFPSFCIGDFNKRIQIFSTRKDYSSFDTVDFERQYQLVFTSASKIITKPVITYNDVGLPRLLADTTFILMYRYNLKEIDSSYRIVFEGENYKVQSTENKDKRNIYFYIYTNNVGKLEKRITK